MGGLFSGTGGFELAAALNGIEPRWTCEIEKYPNQVLEARFPNAKHYGDITTVHGYDIEPVDIICGGSPCQDLSVAGAQRGLHDGERSHLFFEMTRIVKEMRDATDGQFPRFVIWENVPGAFSSGKEKGEDFRAVINEFCGIAESGVDVPRPPKGKWNKSGSVVGDGYCFAWKTIDAQFFGVPQRRKRIYAVLDLGGERAGEILLVPEGMSGHLEQGSEARKGLAEYVAGCPDGGSLPRWIE